MRVSGGQGQGQVGGGLTQPVPHGRPSFHLWESHREAEGREARSGILGPVLASSAAVTSTSGGAAQTAGVLAAREAGRPGPGPVPGEALCRGPQTPPPGSVPQGPRGLLGVSSLVIGMLIS